MGEYETNLGLGSFRKNMTVDELFVFRYNGKRVRNQKDPASYLPLSPAMLHILLALAAGERHGYAIMQEIIQQSQGRYKIGPGTLYDNLQKMMNQALVEECPRPGKDEDPRRRYYRLSRLGKSVLTAEVTRLEEVIHAAKSYLSPALGKRS